MKIIKYTAYLHLSQASEEILFGQCNCKAGAGGCCRHAAALLYQLCEYIKPDLKIVRVKTCTKTCAEACTKVF